jgi:hypothetical protein
MMHPYFAKIHEGQTQLPVFGVFRRLYKPEMPIAQFSKACYEKLEELAIRLRKNTHSDHLIGRKDSLVEQGEKQFLRVLRSMERDYKCDFSVFLKNINNYPENSEEELLRDTKVFNLLNTMVSEAFMFAAGYKTYRIEDGLLSRLEKTEIRGVLGSQVKLPFEPCIWVETREICLLLTKSSDETGTSINVVRYYKNETTAKDSVCSCFSYEIDLDPTKPIQDQDINSDEFYRVVCNILLYITNCHFREGLREEPTNTEWISLGERIQKMPPGKKKERLKERRRELDPEYKIILGKGVQTLNEEKDDLDKDKLMLRVLVSGHWRNQVYGKRKDEFGAKIPVEIRPHESIWIEPFWKGPDWAESKGEAIRIAK